MRSSTTLGNAARSAYTSQFTNRVKCALLGWYAARRVVSPASIFPTRASPLSSKGNTRQVTR